MVVYFKDWAEIERHKDPRFGLTGLTPAEQELRKAVASGHPCILDKTYSEDVADYLPPKPNDWSKPDKTRHIRADVLRFVLLKQVEHGEMTESGTQLFGAQVTSSLNLNNATIHTLFVLAACRFEKAITADRSRSHSNVIFRYSSLPALSAASASITAQLSCEGARLEAKSGNALNLQGTQIGGDVFLRNVIAASTVYINGAKIAGNLECEGARLETTSGNAMSLQGTQIGGDVFLRDVVAASTFDISGATIKGQLACKGARFEATKGIALNLQGAQIGDGFYFREVQASKGLIDLSAAKSSKLVDDAESWALVDDLILDGFQYDRIGGDTRPTFSERMNWLEKGSHLTPNDEKPDEQLFFPQPYTQLADTYKRAGHDREARDVRVALARKLAEEHFKELKKADQSTHDWFQTTKDALPLAAKWFSTPILWTAKILPRHVRKGWYKSVNCMFDWVVGYGFKPSKSLVWLVGLFALATLLSFGSWRAGDFAPNSAPILVSDDWKAVAHLDNAAEQWTADGAAGQDWETFNPLAYAADIVIPIVEIGQTSAWAPSPTRGAWGWTLWWMRWVFTAAGWIVTALGAAAITGVIRRE